MISFNSVKAYPNGRLVYDYGDRIVTELEDGSSLVSYKIYREINGFFHRSEDLLTSISGPSLDDIFYGVASNF